MTTGSFGARNMQHWRSWAGTNRKKGESKMTPHTLTSWQQKRVGTALAGWPLKPIDLDYLVPYSGYVNTALYKTLLNTLVSKQRDVLSQQQYLADLMEAKSIVDLATSYAGQVLSLAKALPKLPRRLLQFRGIKRPRSHGSMSRPPYTRKELEKMKSQKKRLRKLREDRLSMVPAAWLEFWFGAMPLVGSVSGLAETFNVPLDWCSMRVTSPKTHVWSNFFTKGYVQVQIRYLYRLINKNVGWLNRAGLTDVVGTMWEIAPWSWAVDYFLNFGELLSNFDGLFKNSEFKYESTTRFTTSEGSKTGSAGTKEKGWAIMLDRETSVNRDYQLVGNALISTQRLSYLLSAIGITLKGKMS